MENVKVQITDDKLCEVSIAVEIDLHVVNKERDTVFSSILQRAKVPGFRQGKAPLEVIKRTYHENARQQVMENLISRIIPEILRENNIRPVAAPRVEKHDFDFGKAFSLQVKVEKQPDIKVKDYKKIKIKKKLYPVDETQVDRQVDGLRERNARLVAVQDTRAEKEHFVVVDYRGTIDGKPIPGGEAKNQLINLSASLMIQGFAEGMIGMSVGEEKEIEVQFPQEYPQKECAGKKALFFVAVREIKKKILPEHDDEFAKDVGFKTLSEMRDHVRQDMELSAQKKTDKELRDQLCAHVLESNVFPVPQSLIEEHADIMLERTHSLFIQQGYPENAWLKQKEQSQEKIRPEAEKQVRLSYILSAVAAIERIEAKDEDFDAEFNKAVSQSPAREHAIREYYNKHKDEILSRIKEDKLFKFLFDSAKIKIEK